jgi:hypothetical protein
MVAALLTLFLPVPARSSGIRLVEACHRRIATSLVVADLDGDGSQVDGYGTDETIITTSTKAAVRSPSTEYIVSTEPPRS